MEGKHRERGLNREGDRKSYSKREREKTVKQNGGLTVRDEVQMHSR